MKSPQASIIIPVYNGEKFIDKALESVLNQTCRDIEIIIVNDGSTDGTQSLLNSYRSDDRVRIITNQEASGGCYKPYYQGVKAAKGDYVAVLAQDDAFEKDYIERLYSSIVANRLDAVFPIFTVLGYNSNIVSQIPSVNFDFKQILVGQDAVKYILNGWKISTQGGLIKKDILIRSFEYLREPIHSHSDELLSRVILYFCGNIGFSEARYLYGENDGSVSRKISVKKYNYLKNDCALVNMIKNWYGCESGEYVLVQLQNFYDIFKVYREVGLNGFDSSVIKELKIQLKKNSELADFKILRLHTSKVRYYILRSGLIHHLPYGILRYVAKIYKISGIRFLR